MENMHTDVRVQRIQNVLNHHRLLSSIHLTYLSQYSYQEHQTVPPLVGVAPDTNLLVVQAWEGMMGPGKSHLQRVGVGANPLHLNIKKTV